MIQEMRLKPIDLTTDYWISNSGIIFSMKCGKCIEMKQRDDQNTRMRISLNIDGKKVRYSIHRLVMLAFGPPCPEGMYLVRHWDGNYHHNWISNLLWGTHQDNSDDKKRHIEEDDSWI